MFIFILFVIFLILVFFGLFSEVENLIVYLDNWVNVIIGVFVLLFGIIIVVLIIFFEIKKEKLGCNVKEYFLEEVNIKILF